MPPLDCLFGGESRQSKLYLEERRIITKQGKQR